MKKLLLVVILLAVSIMYSSCKEDAATEPTSGAKTLTINHWGVDWSKGVVGTEGNHLPDSDGGTIAWCEYGTTNNFWMEMLMYRPVSGKLYKATTTDLAGLTSIDTTKFAVGLDCGVVKLKPGDIWASECMDGYVAFKVIEAPQDSASISADNNWSVKVEYKFSSTRNF
ncbi:MAG: hypothetical protein KF721_01860 [Ignavibacteriaceae bacterium]|nr:hypothetical protein [Ignavibacteriaceae bacterium]HRI45525.1 hypothetical protein [Ignavibacteriaceae bacterium]